ncbi:hypothetical protein NT6N_02980 [Oceaniferula spumae]|uniref:Uncharacterized protein n=1 Tax=Oceaniferula spumae TaxID=2979115 RepID=A0AAT9FH25_9BACT
MIGFHHTQSSRLEAGGPSTPTAPPGTNAIVGHATLYTNVRDETVSHIKPLRASAVIHPRITAFFVHGRDT